MKKLFLVLLVSLFFITPIFAESRTTSTTKSYTASTLIKTGDWKINRLNFVATANGGSFAVFNSLTDDSAITTTIKVEGSEATSLNGKYYDFSNSPLEGSTGLYLRITTGTVVIEYE